MLCHRVAPQALSLSIVTSLITILQKQLTIPIYLITPVGEVLDRKHSIILFFIDTLLRAIEYHNILHISLVRKLAEHISKPIDRRRQEAHNSLKRRTLPSTRMTPRRHKMLRALKRRS